MAISAGDINANLRLDTREFDRSIRRVKRRLVGSPLLIVYSYALTALAAVLGVLLLIH